MGFFHDLFSGIDDVGHTDLAALDDLARMDLSGFEDRGEQQVRNVMENDTLRTVGLPVADFFSFGLTSPAVRAKYNKMNGLPSGLDAGKIAGTMVGSYLGSELFPYEEANSLGNVAYNVGAGAGRGATTAALTEGSVSDGAKSGAISAGLGSGGSYLGRMTSDNTGYVPTDSGTGLYNETTQQSSAPQQPMADYFRPEGQTTPQQSTSSYVPADSPRAYTSTKTTAPDATQPAGSLTQQFSEFLGGLLPSTQQRFGDTAQGLLGMYSGYRRSKSAKQLMNSYGSNREAYVNNLRTQLQARDAAAGRRSNYSGRETELQASLAQLDSKNAPALHQLNEIRYSGLDNMMRSGLQMGGNLGWFGQQYARPDYNFRPVRPVSSLPAMPDMPMPTPLSLDELARTPRTSAPVRLPIQNGIGGWGS